MARHSTANSSPQAQNTENPFVPLRDTEHLGQLPDDLLRGSAFFRFDLPQGDRRATHLSRQLLLC